MSNKRITDLTELTNPTTDDVFPVVDIATNTTTKVQLGNLPVPSSVTTALATKQDTLVSGTNIKTLNNTSLLGSGNIVLTANPSGVSGAIQFSNGSAFASDASNLFWDDTNNRLGIGTNVPTEKLQVVGSDNENMLNLTAVGGKFIVKPFLNGVYGTFLDARNNTDNSPIPITIGGSSIFLLATNNIGIGTDAPTARLNVRGSGSTSATTSLLVQNSSGAASLQVTDDGSVYNLGKGASASNTAFGRLALISNTSGDENAIFGTQAGASITIGVQNIAMGFQALTVLSSGVRNIAIGALAMQLSSSTAGNNVAIGYRSLVTDSGSNNTAVGTETSAGGFSGSTILGVGAAATASNQFVVGSSTINAGAIDSSAFTQDKRWKVKINGVDYYIALQTA